MKNIKSIFILLLFAIYAVYIIFLKKLPFSMYGDNLIYNFPLFYYISQVYSHGHIPLWNPYIFGGQSLIGNPLSGIFYPLYWLPFILSHHIERALDISLLIHIFIAEIGMYLLLREYNCNKFSSIVGAITYGCSGILLLLGTGFIQMLGSAAWAPFVLLGVRRLCIKPIRKNVFFLSFIVFVQFLSSYPQYCFYTLIIGFIYYFAYLLKNFSKNLLLAGIKSILLIFFLCLPLTIIILKMMLSTNRIIGIHKTISYTEYISQYFKFKDLLIFFIPHKITKIFNVKIDCSPFFLGFPSLIGFLLIFFLRKRSLHLILYSILLILFFLNTLGPHNFWQHLLYHIPIFNLFRSVIKHSFEIILISSIITGLVFSNFKNKILYFFIILLCIYQINFQINNIPDFYLNIFKKNNQNYFLYSQDLNNKFHELINKKNFNRLLSVDGQNIKFLYSPIPFNYPIIYQISALHGYGPTLPEIYNYYLKMNNGGFILNSTKKLLLTKKRWFLNLFNVKYIFIKKEYIKNHKNVKELNIEKISKIYKNYSLLENLETYGFAFFVKKIEKYNNFQKIIIQGEKNSLFGKKIGYLKNIPHNFKKLYTGKIEKIIFNHFNPNTVKLIISTSGPAFLGISIPFDNLWRIYINGKKTKIYNLDGLIIGIFVKNRGKKEITLRYLL